MRGDQPGTRDTCAMLQNLVRRPVPPPGEGLPGALDIIRELRGVGVNNHRPTIRAGIAIARILAHHNSSAQIGDSVFETICHDVLNTDTAKITHQGQSLMAEKVNETIRAVCGDRPPRSKNRRKAEREKR